METDSSTATGARRSRGPAYYATLSLVVGVAVLALKLGAWGLTGSVALLSDALESIVNVAAAGLALLMIRLAAKPPDARHPYGHHKAEYISAVVEGVLILAAAASIILQAAPRFVEPEAARSVGVGLAVSVLASALNAALAWRLVRAGRRLRSPALEADGHHVYSDVITSAGVVLGVGLAKVTGAWLLDPLIAVLVALNIVRIGLRTVASSVGGLLDEALPKSTQDNVREAIESAMGEALEAHALRTRRAGRYAFVAFHLVVPGEMTVAAAHEICDRLEEAVRGAVPGALVTIHIEPESKAKRSLDEHCAGSGRVYDLAGPNAPPPFGE